MHIGSRTARLLALLLLPVAGACGEDTPIDPGPGTPSADTLDLRDGFWLSAPPIPGEPAQPGLVEFNGSLYAVGGSWGGPLNMDSTSSEVYRLDRNANLWVQLADYPQSGWGVTLGVLGDSLFGLGGSGIAGDGGGRQFYVYKPDTDSWDPRPRAPESRQNGAAVEANGWLVVVGGTVITEQAFPTGTPLIYNPGLGEWGAGAPMPDPLTSVGAATVDGLVYVAGGVRVDNAFQVDSRIRVFDVLQNQWTLIDGPFALDRSQAAFAYADGRIHLLGGTRGTNRERDTHVAYTIADSTWVRYTPLPFETRSARAAALGDAIILIEAWWDAQTTPTGRASIFRTQSP